MEDGNDNPPPQKRQTKSHWELPSYISTMHTVQDTRKTRAPKGLWLLNNANLLLPEQSGFRPHHSCTTALTRITDSWLHSINEGKMIGILYVDLHKAFDSINHTLLLKKNCLKEYRCRNTDAKYVVFGTLGEGLVESGAPMGMVCQKSGNPSRK